MKKKTRVSLRHAFVAPKGMLIASSDFSAQEFRNAGALSKDVNIAKIYKLEKEYIDKIRPKPINPLTNKSYDDPACDPHIQAAVPLDNEVKRIVLEEPWRAIKEDLHVGPWRQKGKVMNYRLIYLCSAMSLAPELGVSKEEAQAFIDKYFSYPDGFYGLGEYLKSTALIGSEVRWVRTATGELIFVNESNSKGLSDSGAASRKSVNSPNQGLGSTQKKIALALADKKFTKLNDKYRNVIRGREGVLGGEIHDESLAFIPGECYFHLVPDEKLNEKYNTDIYVKPQVEFDENIGEHALALEYGAALKSSMEEAMQETFDIIGTDIPPGSSVEVAPWWIH